MKLQVSDQLQTVSASSFQKLKTIIRQEIDQTIRTLNFRVRNVRFETGALLKRWTGRNVSAERKVGECFHCKATGQCSRRDSCSFTHGEASGIRRDHTHGIYSGQRAQSSFSALKTSAQPARSENCKNDSPREPSPSELTGRKRPCKDFLKGKCTEPSCDL